MSSAPLTALVLQLVPVVWDIVTTLTVLVLQLLPVVGPNKPLITYPGYQTSLNLLNPVDLILGGWTPQLAAIVQVRLDQRLESGQEYVRASCSE